MRLGCVSICLQQFDFEEGLALLQRLGIEAIEIGCAGYHVPKYGDPQRLLADKSELERWQDALRRHDIDVSALAVHGQPLTPDREAAAEYSRQFRQACRFAEAINVTRLTLLGGLPEGAPGDSTPCWVVAPHPPGNADVLRWQWQERVIPYWREHGLIAEEHGCRLCFEMHPGDVVYNPATLWNLRDEVGPVIGCNFDPSHLIWQGIDPFEAVRFLGEAIYHVHAKDTGIQYHISRLNGVLDPKPQARAAERGWVFRLPGFGHGELFWREFVTTLRQVGYDDVVSIEHEDEYIGVEEGLEKTVAVLRPLIPQHPIGRRWWEASD